MQTRQFAAILAVASGTLAKTVEYNWTVDWVHAAPDGFMRPVIGVNGQWPCPQIDANVGDTIVVNMVNNLVNETTGLHFHGFNMVGTNYEDGASMVNGCPTPPGDTIQYKFLADAPGTYWYHSHNMGQYPDGLRGSIIVHDPQDPYAGKYDEEVVLTMSDWYHSQSLPLVQQMLSANNTQFRPPIPDNMTINEGTGANIKFEVGKTYRLRIINFSAIGPGMLHFANHKMNVIMIDSSYVQMQEVDQLRVSPAQRYDVLITAEESDKGSNFPYLVAMDINRDYHNAPVWTTNVTGHLVTDESLPTTSVDVVDLFQPFDEAKFAPYSKQPLFAPVTKTWTLDFEFCKDANGFPRACFNNVTYVSQKVPALYTAATVQNNSDPTIYAAATNPFVVEYGDIVEIIVNNLDAAIHPFHLHGHQFQIVEISERQAGKYTGNSTGNAFPPQRDVLAINGGGYARLRFVANNPGIFLFHCHIEWHVEMGLTATLIEAPEKLFNITIPQSHLDACTKQGIPIAGNAAGNTQDPTDTSGFINTPPTVYYGALYPQPAAMKRAALMRKPSGQNRRESW